MKIFLDKTVEEMHELGYRPILDTAILAPKEDVYQALKAEDFGDIDDLIIQSYQNGHSNDPQVEKIDSVVLKTRFAGVVDCDGGVTEYGGLLTIFPRIDYIERHIILVTAYSRVE